jgi:hypothetical protein
VSQLFTPHPTRVIPIVLILAAAAATGSAHGPASLSAAPCQLSGALARIPDLPEASGLAISRRTPGRLWSHNDSGQPVLVALDARGTVTARVRLTGVKIDDWEAIAVGACPGGSCVYVGDIGDNEAKRQRITIYRVPEPAGEGSAGVNEAFHATYPDGAHDAETLLVAPDGGLFIVTKGDTGAIGLYRFPRDLRAGETHRLERVGEPRGGKRPSETERITDGAVSTDGSWVILRTNDRLAFHRSADLFAGRWAEAGRVDLKAVGEPQGEGVAMDKDGTVYLAGEGGGKSQPGTLGRLNCTVKP